MNRAQHLDREQRVAQEDEEQISVRQWHPPSGEHPRKRYVIAMSMKGET
jgi:hypothetical protein